MTRQIRPTQPHSKEHGVNRHLAIAASLVVCAVVLGGGGSPNPHTELWLELLAGLAFLAWLWLPGALRLPTDPLPWCLAGLVLLLPILQLIPLPPAIWQELPGREVQRKALALIGERDSWQPFSTSPPRTLASLLSLVPPLLLMLMTASFGRRERRVLIGAIAAMAVISAVLGALQISSGSEALSLYSGEGSRVVLGFQANRNATADVLLIGLVALAAYAASSPHVSGRSDSRRSRRDGWWLAGAAVLLTLACVLTASRTGVALIVPAAMAAWAILALDPGRLWNRTLPAIAAGIGALLAGGLFLSRHNTMLQRVAERFDFAGDGREALWRDTLYAIGQYWPLGSGMGTFVPTFIALEPLEAVDPSVPNRAHNDYLEFALESGAIGIALLVIVVLLILFMAQRSWRREAEGRPQIGFGLAALALIAAHSIVDYPLRSMSLACLAAIAAGMLSRSRPTDHSRDRRDSGPVPAN